MMQFDRDKGQFLARAESQSKLAELRDAARCLVGGVGCRKWFISDDRLLDLIKFTSTLTQQVNRFLANTRNFYISDCCVCSSLLASLVHQSSKTSSSVNIAIL